MRSQARLALAAAGIAALGLALPAHAAGTPATLVLTDPAGDQKVPVGHGDITKVTYTTAGTTTTKRVGGKTVTTYTPTKLVVTMTTADALDTTGTTEYEVDGALAGCDSFDLYFTPGVSGSEGGGCYHAGSSPTSSTSEGVDGPPTVTGNTLTWTVPFASISSRALKAGAVISGIDAFTATVEPVQGFIGPYLIDAALDNDELASDASFKVA